MVFPRCFLLQLHQLANIGQLFLFFFKVTVYGIVVIAEDGVHSAGGCKPLELLLERQSLLRLHIDQVAGKEDDVALLLQRLVDKLGYACRVVAVGAEVEV